MNGVGQYFTENRTFALSKSLCKICVGDLFRFKKRKECKTKPIPFPQTQQTILIHGGHFYTRCNVSVATRYGDVALVGTDCDTAVMSL